MSGIQRLGPQDTSVVIGGVAAHAVAFLAQGLVRRADFHRHLDGVAFEECLSQLGVASSTTATSRGSIAQRVVHDDKAIALDRLGDLRCDLRHWISPILSVAVSYTHLTLPTTYSV